MADRLPTPKGLAPHHLNALMPPCARSRRPGFLGTEAFDELAGQVGNQLEVLVYVKDDPIA